MHGESLSFYVILDSGLDMMVNMAAFCLSYVLLELAGIPAVLPLINGATLSMLFFGVIPSTLVYQLFRLYGRITYFGARRVIAPVILANTAFFGLLILLTALFSEGEKQGFVITWCVTAGVVSTLAMVVKKALDVRSLSLD